MTELDKPFEEKKKDEDKTKKEEDDDDDTGSVRKRRKSGEKESEPEPLQDPLVCRFCQFNGEDEEDMVDHRKLESHRSGHLCSCSC